MDTASTLQRLRRFNDNVHAADSHLAEETRDLAEVDRERLAVRAEAVGAVDPMGPQVEAESIILRRERPVLAIIDDKLDLTFQDAQDSAVWKARLQAAASKLDGPIRAIGRIDLKGGRLEWVGTGWLIHPEVLVTNRHVAAEFARRKGAAFEFRVGDAGPMSASTDFRREMNGANDGQAVFELVRPLHIEEAPGPDIAFFEIRRENRHRGLAEPVKLASRAHVTSQAGVIGYPAYDSRIPDVDLMNRLFGSVYDCKRFAPGAVTRVEAGRLLHNATTLGGNSGSAVIDLETGEAMGLHFSGSFLSTNYAVSSDVVWRTFQAIRTARSRTRPPARRLRIFARADESSGPAGQGASITVPLTITVSLGNPARAPAPRIAIDPRGAQADDTGPGDEAPVASYADRKGYREDFLGDGFDVPMPVVDEMADDVLEIEGADDNVLRYHHFSVVMSESRRMCFFSAVNIDGAQSKKSARVSWKWDPRIPRENQIKDECYGNSPKFSRGHMTRREDPGWGRTLKDARRGNEDSMHVTNVTPQIQAFNSPIWLALEDYALEHAREDDMRISVFTGPYFDDDDPERYGVRIPLGFWKVIAFIHDETGELCATGYEMSQEGSLPSEDEFVFGQFVSPQLNVATQVSIADIQQRSGLDFGALVDADPLAHEEAVAGPRAPLMDMGEIRFL